MQKYKQEEIFRSMPVGAALRTMAIPTIFGQIIVLIYNLADTFYIGRTNDPCMVAGISLILPIFNTLVAISNFPGIGGGTLLSHQLGLGDRAGAKKTAGFSIWLGILLAGLLSLSTLLFMHPLLTVLGADASTYLYAKQYLMCVIVVGGIPTVLSNVCSNLLRSTGASRQAGFGVAMGGILNIILDPIFMFLLLPKGSEILGVGIATCLSNMITCIYYIGVFVKLRKQSVLTFRLYLPDRKSISAICNVGLPAAVVMLLFDLDYVIIDRLMSAYTPVALAAIGIVLKSERLPLNIGIGLCQAMMPLVAYNFAAKNEKRMDDVTNCALRAGVISAIICIALYELFAPLIIRFFISDPDTVTIGASFLRARCLATVFMFLSFFVVHLFQAYGMGELSLLLGVIRWVALNIPLLFILNHFFGMYGIVWGQFIGDILNAAASFLILKIKKPLILATCQES